MRVLLYEWVTGGGLAGHHGALPESLLREGLAMAQALAADAADCESVEATLLRDRRVRSLVAPRARVVEVDSEAEHRATLREETDRADAVLVLAPETDGALLDAVRLVESAETRLLSPSSEFAATAGDKEETARRLRESNVPTPASVRLEPGDPLPDGFEYPAVVKPIDGAGSQDTLVVSHAADRPPAYAWPRRIERYAPGIAASVALLCQSGEPPSALPPCRQRLSSDGRLAYLGGSTPLPGGLAERAAELAHRALAAMPITTGYVGVDIVLGAAPDGAEDVVIEVNPRLTTSYVGLRAACRGNLLQAMIAVASGERAPLKFDSCPIAFDADGAVYYDEPRQ